MAPFPQGRERREKKVEIPAEKVEKRGRIQTSQTASVVPFFSAVRVSHSAKLRVHGKTFAPASDACRQNPDQANRRRVDQRGDPGTHCEPDGS